ncbi:MAG: DUF1080 domain-containing protein [Nannocystaceae bacterium]|nr:DUF1080 domain-containing protein [Nannocystaceae bacterium]
MRSISLAVLTLALGCDAQDPAPAEHKQEATQAPAADDSKSASAASTATPLKRWAFNKGATGSTPPGFELLETAAAGTPATWGLVEDAAAPSGGKGFGVLNTTNAGQTYNVALAAGFEADDVELTVSLKADAGTHDQGGGVVFRANGARDYYVARWNPLEKNVRFYVVAAEQRSAFKAADIDLDPSQWHTMRVLVEGPRMELFMNGTSVLVATDETLKAPGRIGLWTKADASTWFDDLTAQEL